MKIWKLCDQENSGHWGLAMGQQVYTGRLGERTEPGMGQCGHGPGCRLNTGILGLEEKL